jgi:hypothetical protein
MRMVVALPESVGSEEAEDAARRDGQVETVDGELSASVALGERAGGDDRFPGRGIRAARLRLRGGRFAHRLPRSLDAPSASAYGTYLPASAAFTSASLVTRPT